MNVLGKAITHSILFRWEYNKKGWLECVGDGEEDRRQRLANSGHCLPFVNVIFHLEAELQKESAVGFCLVSILFSLRQQLLGDQTAPQDIRRFWELADSGQLYRAAHCLSAPSTLPANPSAGFLQLSAAQP